MKIRAPQGSVGLRDTLGVGARSSHRTPFVRPNAAGPLEPASATYEPTGCGLGLPGRVGSAPSRRATPAAGEQREAGEREFPHREPRPHPGIRSGRYSADCPTAGSARAALGPSRHVDSRRLSRAAAPEAPARRRRSRAGRGCSARHRRPEYAAARPSSTGSRLGSGSGSAAARAPAADASVGAGARLRGAGSRPSRAPVGAPVPGSSATGAATRPLAEHLRAQRGRGDPGRRLVARGLRIATRDLLERLRRAAGSRAGRSSAAAARCRSAARRATPPIRAARRAPSRAASRRRSRAASSFASVSAAASAERGRAPRATNREPRRSGPSTSACVLLSSSTVHARCRARASCCGASRPSARPTSGRRPPGSSGTRACRG